MRHLLAYDFEQNCFINTPMHGSVNAVSLLTQGVITGLSYNGKYLWILTSGKELSKMAWQSGMAAARFDLNRFGLSRSVGLEVVKGKIYFTDGNHPNPIYVFEERTIQT